MRNVSTKIDDTPNSADGVLTAAEFNSYMNELENACTSIGETLSSLDENQLGKAMAGYAAASDFYTDSGTADSYILAVVGTRQAPHDYIDGMKARFVAGNTNTGASTVNLAGKGSKNIRRSGGAALSAGDIVAGNYIELTFRSGVDYWIISQNVTITGDQTIFDLKIFDEAPRASADPSNASDLVRLSYLQSYVTESLVIPNGYIYGLDISNNGSDANNDIDIATGVCRSSANTFNMTLSAALTKRLDAAWAAGTNQGGLFSGTKTLSTAYHVFLIRKTSDGTIDAGFDTSITAANIPTGYVGYRRLGTIYTDASNNIIAFYKVGDYFWFKTPVVNVNGTSQSNAAFSTRTLTTPPGKETLSHIFLRHLCSNVDATADNYLIARETNSLNDTGITIPSPAFMFGTLDMSSLDNTMGSYGIGYRQTIVANTSAQIETKMSETAANIYITTLGYWDKL